MQKTLATKEWVSREGLSIWEMEWCMDTKMFLDEHLHWEAEWLHCPLILQEMFLQAAHSGRKEAEWVICQGCQHDPPHLDPQVDVPMVQVVGPWTSREEIRDLYYQVYKLWRLPGSLLCGLEWAEELVRNVVSSLKNHLEKPPERGPTTKGTGRVWACWCLAIAEQDPKKEEKGHFHWARPCWGKGGPLKSPSSHSCTGGEDQKAELFHHQRLAGCPHPFSELQPP